MNLEIKKMKADISPTLKKNSVTGPYERPEGRDKLLIPPVKGEG